MQELFLSSTEDSIVYASAYLDGSLKDIFLNTHEHIYTAIAFHIIVSKTHMAYPNCKNCFI